jgi:hypothetical protein
MDGATRSEGGGKSSGSEVKDMLQKEERRRR